MATTHLGGDDFDLLLLDHVLARFLATGAPDVRGDRRAMSRVLRAAEEAKKRLSFEPYTRLREEHLAARDGVPVHLDLEVSREEYERLIRHLVERTLDSVHRALADAGKQPGDVDEILLVGGVTRTPLVSQLLRDTTGLAPRQDVAPRPLRRPRRWRAGRPAGRPRRSSRPRRHLPLLVRPLVLRLRRRPPPPTTATTPSSRATRPCPPAGATATSRWSTTRRRGR